MGLVVRLLGPLEVERDGRPVALTAPKERSIVALLALGAGRVVSIDRLVDELWEDPPPSARAATRAKWCSPRSGPRVRIAGIVRCNTRAPAGVGVVA